MKTVSQHPVYGEIICTENFWTGKKTVTIDGTEYRVKRKQFTFDDKKVTVKGSLYWGAKMIIDGESFPLGPQAAWYECALALLPIIFCLVWGNSIALCSILPIMGGGLGGLIAAIFGCASLACMRKAKSLAAKLIIGIAFFIVSVIASCVLAIALMVVLYM